MTGGDSAIVAIQYSYLPSWISYLVDQKRGPRGRSRPVRRRVRATGSTLPQTTGPGCSSSARASARSAARRRSAARSTCATAPAAPLLTGPPNFNTLYREFTDDRDPGTTEVAADLPGRPDRPDRRHDRDAGQPADGRRGTAPRILYVQHPSDPIVWWSPHLILTEPDWLASRAATTCSPTCTGRRS